MPSVDGLTFSDHALKRISQRAIKPWMVEVASNYDDADFDGRGCSSIQYIVTDRALRNIPYEIKRERLHGLCIVVSIVDGAIVTVEWISQLRHGYPWLTFQRIAKNWTCYLRSNKWVAQEPLILA